MPFVTYATKAAFDDLYSMGAESGHPNTRNEVRLNYHKSVIMPGMVERASGLINVFGWDINTKLCIVGCAFGWFSEALSPPLNLLNIYQIDDSPYIQAEKFNTETTEVEAEISKVGLDPNTGEGLTIKGSLDDGLARASISLVINDSDFSKAGDRQKVKNALGSNIIIFTEDVLTSLFDSEAIDLSTNLNKIPNQIQVIHLVSTLEAHGVDTGDLNWKTLANWKALIPADTFIEVGTYRIL